MSRIVAVRGCPGAGKTRYLVRQCERAADTHGPGRIAIASLTRAAATEIAGRVAIPDDQVGTLHAHCHRALDRPLLAETPEGLAAWSDAHPALAMTGGQRHLDDTPVEAEAGRTRGDELRATVAIHRARMTPVERWTDDERQWWAQWSDWKTQTGRLDFTDLIEKAAADLPAHPAAPKVLLLDEAQDFSALELRLAARWARHTETTVICGDVDQALYTWRGAAPDELARLDVADTRPLLRSHRVPRAIAQLANAWIRQVDGRDTTAFEPTDQPGSVRTLAVSLRHVDPMLAAIQADLDAGRKVMILASCEYMLAPVLKMLRGAGIPFANPYRETHGGWNPMRAAGRLASWLRPDDRVWGDNARSWTWADLHYWIEPLQARGVLQRGAKTLIAAKCEPDRFGESQADEEPSLEALASIFGSLRHPLLRGDVDYWTDHLLASWKDRATYPLQVLHSQGARALVDEPRCTVGTIHSVKGATTDDVYLFPDLSRTGYWHGWQTGGPGRDAIVRMIYVALTRARRSVTLLDPSSPEHVPVDLILGGWQPAQAVAA